jgi:hypothetical protein
MGNGPLKFVYGLDFITYVICTTRTTVHSDRDILLLGIVTASNIIALVTQGRRAASTLPSSTRGCQIPTRAFFRSIECGLDGASRSGSFQGTRMLLKKPAEETMLHLLGRKHASALS